jgi:hypothetical protein
MRRTWIKLYVETLRSSMISELSPEQRWMFVGLILMAGDSPIPGVIYARKDENGRPVGYPDTILAFKLGVHESAIQPGLSRMVEKGKVTIDELAVISICNWKKYQSEYERTKHAPSRGVQKYGLDVDVEVDVDGEVDKKFIEFWSAYPRKVAKKVAAKAYAAAIKAGAKPEDLLKSLVGYRAELEKNRTEERFVKHPSTFLHEECWRDYLDRPAVVKVGQRDPSKPKSERELAYESARAEKLAELSKVGGDPEYIKEELARWSVEWWAKEGA